MRPTSAAVPRSATARHHFGFSGSGMLPKIAGIVDTGGARLLQAGSGGLAEGRRGLWTERTPQSRSLRDINRSAIVTNLLSPILNRVRLRPVSRPERDKQPRAGHRAKGNADVRKR